MALTKVPLLPKSKMPLILLLTDKFQRVTNGTPGARQNSSCNLACEASAPWQAFLAVNPAGVTLPFLASVFPGVRDGSSWTLTTFPERQMGMQPGAPCVSENYVRDSVVAFEEDRL